MASNEGWNPKRFDGMDYSKFRLRFILYVKRKEWYTVLDTAKPTVSGTDTTAADAWDKIDVKVQSTLVDAVTDKILDEICHETTAKGMLDALDSVYLRKTLLMRILATKKLLNLRMTDGESAADFFSRFEKHISPLKDAGAVVSLEEKLHYLLLVLPDKYSHIIDVLDAMPEYKRTVDYVIGKVMFDHCKSEGSTEFADSFGNVAMRAQVSFGSEKPPTNYTCHRCGIPSHFRRDCRAKLQGAGFSDQWNSSGRRWNGNRGNVNSNNTEVLDHSEMEVSSFQVTVMSSEVEESMPGSEIGTIPEGVSDATWVMDSACTSHIVNTDKYFFRKTKIEPPSNIRVGDGLSLIHI